MIDTNAPQHIWDAIELIHRKSINENERRREHDAGGGTAVAVPNAAARPSDAEIEESDRELRLVTDARRQYRELYDGPADADAQEEGDTTWQK